MTEGNKMTSITPMPEYKESSLFDSLKSILATAVPQSGIAAILSYFASMNLALLLLVVSMGAHLGSSFLVVVFTPTEKGIKSFLKDLLVRALALAVVTILGSRPELEYTIAGQPVSAAAFIGFFIILSEVIGFGHDMEDLGMQIIPKFAMNWFQNAKDGMNSGEAITMLTSFSKRTSGGVEVVNKSTTVVTTKPPEAPSV